MWTTSRCTAGADHYMLMAMRPTSTRTGRGHSHSVGRAEWKERETTRPRCSRCRTKAEALVARSRRDVIGSTIPLRPRGGGRVPPSSRARYTGERWLRAVVAAAGRAPVGRPDRGGAPGRHPAIGLGARHAAARDEVRALRQRHRPDHEPPRGGARWVVKPQGRVIGPRPSRRSARGDPPQLVGFEMVSGRCPATATASCPAARRWAWSPRLVRPVVERSIGMGYVRPLSPRWAAELAVEIRAGARRPRGQDPFLSLANQKA